MSRRFWGGLMLFSVIVAGGSAYVLYSHVTGSPLFASSASGARRALNQDPAEATPVTPPPAPAEAAPVTPPSAPEETGTVEPVAETTPVVEPVEAAPEPAEKSPDVATKKRNILFSLPRPNAKKVFIIGDFNKWYRQPMKKQGKAWQVSVELKPGRYQYLFVVDDKRIVDPNNKSVADGKSVLVVKPAAAN